VIAIIGCNGYIGRHLTNALLNKYHFSEINLYGNRDKSIDGYVNYTKIDISLENSWREVLEKNKIIYFLPSLTGVLNSFIKASEFIFTNELGLIKLLETVKLYNFKPHIIFPSTRLVYSSDKDFKLKECDVHPDNFKSIYSLNKFSCEKYLELYSKYFQIDFTVFRISVPFGSNFENFENSYGIVNHFVNSAMKHKKIQIYGDGLQKRTFTYIDDLINIFIKCIENPLLINDIFNIGGNDHFSIYELANKISKKYDAEISLLEWDKFSLQTESGHTIFDSTKLDSIIGGDNYTVHFDEWLNNKSR
jgi:UDP-glucose 4-epimerase